MFVGPEPLHINPDADIASIVLMPGDPLRAKYIAEKFLEDYKEVTNIRNMLGFTGYYKGNKITVMGSGMGMPSMSIYAFELFHFFNVQKIIRIGTCGALSDKVKLNEIILPNKIYSESKFAYTYNDYDKDVVIPNEDLNNAIKEIANITGLSNSIEEGMLATVDVFGPYIDYQRVVDRIPKEYEILGEDMEAFALVHIANIMQRKATAMVTVVNSKYDDRVLTTEEREKSLDDMIALALEAIIKE